MRPTGKLHLGNYMGALYNWVRLQHDYNCYFFVADWHALTTDYADTSNLRQNTMDVALDWLAAGLDPERCVLFVQSLVPQHAELHLLLSMIMPLGWLERVPTYKEQQLQLGEKDLTTYGFLGYPLLMATDILIYQADFVPVGQDQVAHVEVTREVARRFNHFYPGPGSPDSARAAGAVDSLAQAARHGWAQDVQELWQHHPADGSGAGGAAKAEDHGDRSGAGAAERPWRSRCMPGGRSAQGLFDSGDAGRRSMPDAGRRASAASSAKAGPRTRSWPNWSPCSSGEGNMRSSPRLVHDILHSGSELARARAEETMEQVREAMHLVQPEYGERAQ